MQNIWIARYTSPSRSLTVPPRVRLFCLPYAGGSSAIYRQWCTSFPEDVDVCPIQLPGRLARFREAPFYAVHSLVEALHKGVEGLLDVPFAVFGYSLGSLIAYEWVRHVVRVGAGNPRHLVVAARGAPQCVALETERTSDLSDDELIEHIVQRYGCRFSQVLGDADLRRLSLRSIRADLAMIETYVHRPGAPLSVPVTAIGGLHDHTTPSNNLNRWRDVTSAHFTLRMISGDHFFIHTAAESLRALVSECIQ